MAPVTNRATMWIHLHHHQHHNVETSPSSSTGPTYKRGKMAWPSGPLPLCLFISLSLSYVYPRSFPWSIKGKAGHPTWGSFFDHSEAHHDLRGTSTLVHPHQRLGSSSLSRPFVIPTTNSSASNTNSLPLDVGTFRLNQYTSSCPLCTPSEPRRAILKFY
jgi:hypothetical protein